MILCMKACMTIRDQKTKLYAPCREQIYLATDCRFLSFKSHSFFHLIPLDTIVSVNVFILSLLLFSIINKISRKSQKKSLFSYFPFEYLSILNFCFIFLIVPLLNQLLFCQTILMSNF
jgi:hypothetical protein